MDGVISSQVSLGGEADKYQPWVEECGLRVRAANFHPAKLRSPQAAACSTICAYEDQKIALTYLKKRYDEILGQNTRIPGVARTNGDTIKVMKELGHGCVVGILLELFLRRNQSQRESPPAILY